MGNGFVIFLFCGLLPNVKLAKYVWSSPFLTETYCLLALYSKMYKFKNFGLQRSDRKPPKIESTFCDVTSICIVPNSMLGRNILLCFYML